MEWSRGFTKHRIVDSPQSTLYILKHHLQSLWLCLNKIANWEDLSTIETLQNKLVIEMGWTPGFEIPHDK